jgi:hypothetical protein
MAWCLDSDVVYILKSESKCGMWIAHGPRIGSISTNALNSPTFHSSVVGLKYLLILGLLLCPA